MLLSFNDKILQESVRTVVQLPSHSCEHSSEQSVIGSKTVGFPLKADSYHETGRACLLRHETDLYQKTTCIMKQVSFKIITSYQ